MGIHQQRTKFIYFLSIVIYLLFSGTLYSQNISKTIAICTASGVQKDVQMVSDGNGGAILIWLDSRKKYPNKFRRYYYDIYAQRVNGEGSTLFRK